MRLIGSSRASQPRYTIHWHASGKSVSYSSLDFEARVDAEKKLLSNIGIKAGTKVGIRGDNSYLWMVTDIALTELDAVSIVFPKEFNDHDLDDLIATYGLSFFLITDAATVSASSDPNIAVMGQIEADNHTLRPVVKDPYPVTDDDHSFVFSSGTSGAFKGMVISKKGVRDQIETFCAAHDVTENDSIIFFMPFSSMQNRVLYYAAITFNADIVVVPSTMLLDGLKRYQPTFLVAPPIFYEAVEKSIKVAQARVSLIKRTLLAVASRAVRLMQHIIPRRASASLLRRIHRNAYDIFGGRMRVMITGMAKIGLSTLEFYKTLGLPMLQVYGLTETGVVCVNTLTNNQIGTVGRPLPGNNVSIAEDGEIVVHKEAPETNRFFHFEDSSEDTRFEDGGVYTGDLGHLSEDGTLTLVGRKKSTIVGNSGVKVQPEPIEKVLEENMLVAKAVLVGLDNGRSLGVAVQTIRSIDGIEYTTLEEEVRKVVRDMAASFKDHLRLAITEEDFTADNGLLTRNLKINRTAVRTHFFESTLAR